MKKTLWWGAAIGALVVTVSLAGLLEVPELQALNNLFELRGSRLSRQLEATPMLAQASFHLAPRKQQIPVQKMRARALAKQ